MKILDMPDSVDHLWRAWLCFEGKLRANKIVRYPPGKFGWVLYRNIWAAILKLVDLCYVLNCSHEEFERTVLRNRVV